MFEFLLEPIIDTYYFGCPTSCIVPNGDLHQFLKIIFTPAVVIGVTVGSLFGTLFALGRLPDLRSLRSFRLRGKTVTEAILDSPEAEVVVHKEHEPKSIKQYERAIRKEKRNDFLKNLDEMDSNPEIAFSKFLELQDHENHPMSEPLEVVRTEAKEERIEPEHTAEVKMNSEKEQEFYKENKESLEEQAKQVSALMKSENITEDEAIDRIIKETPELSEEKRQDLFTDICEDDDEIKCAVDVFKLDEKPKVYPKPLRFWHKHFKKKEKPKYNFNLNDLGRLRRDQYAEQIEIKLAKWALPMPKYAGKNQEYQMEETILKSELKKFALFMSMSEMMADKRKSKKAYWEKVKVA